METKSDIACYSLEEAIELSRKIKEGDVEMPIGNMLEVFSIIYGYCQTYLIRIHDTNNEIVQKEATEKSNQLLSILEGFDEIFFDFEMEIVSYFQSLKKSQMTEKELAVANLFFGVAKLSKELGWNRDKFQLKD